MKTWRAFFAFKYLHIYKMDILKEDLFSDGPFCIESKINCEDLKHFVRKRLSAKHRVSQYNHYISKSFFCLSSKFFWSFFSGHKCVLKTWLQITHQQRDHLSFRANGPVIGSQIAWMLSVRVSCVETCNRLCVDTDSGTSQAEANTETSIAPVMLWRGGIPWDKRQQVHR